MEITRPASHKAIHMPLYAVNFTSDILFFSKQKKIDYTVISTSISSNTCYWAMRLSNLHLPLIRHGPLTLCLAPDLNVEL